MGRICMFSITIALLAALMPMLVAGQNIRYMDPDIDVPVLRFPRDQCSQYFPAGGGVGHYCKYNTMGRVAVIGKVGHVSGSELTNTWNQQFIMSGNDATYLTYDFGPNCKLEQNPCNSAYYAECGIDRLYTRASSCTQRICLRSVQSYLGACTVKVELHPDMACSNTTGYFWNYQSNKLTLERDLKFILPAGETLPRGMGQNQVNSNTYLANPRACLYTCVNSRDP